LTNFKVKIYKRSSLKRSSSKNKFESKRSARR